MKKLSSAKGVAVSAGESWQRARPMLGGVGEATAPDRSRMGPRSRIDPGAPTDVRETLKKRLALTTGEVAELLGISTAAVRLMIARGFLPGKKVGGGVERITYIVPTGALLEWLDSRTPAAAEGAA
jgi:excisionase family DNA binding protein